MKKHSSTAGSTGMARIRSLLAFRHQSAVARLVSTIAAFAIAVLLIGVNAAPVQAAGTCDLPGGFEIDGDMTAQNCAPTPGDDWSAHTISPTDVGSTSQTGTYSPSGDDTGNPSTWVDGGGTPPKGDFEVEYSFAKIVNGHYIVYVAWERDATAGTGGYVIEIDNSAPHTGGGVPQPDRSGGGSTYYLSATGSAAPTLTCKGAFASQAQYGPNLGCPPGSSSGFYSAINGSAITDSFSNQSVATSGFYEVALDVTELTGVAPSCPGPTAASLYIRSLTGQVKNGNLKGFTGPLSLKPDTTCVAPTIATQTQQNPQIDGLDVVAPNTNQHDVATVTGIAAHPAPTGSVAFSLCGPTASPANCTTGGQSGGTTSLTQHASNSTAQSDDVSPSAPGWYCWRAEFTPDPVNDGNPFLPATATDKTNECFRVAHATPSIATTSSADTGSGAATHSIGFTALGDTATLSNVESGADLTGQNVSFSLYRSDSAPTANDCTANQLVSGPVDAPLTKVNDTTWHAVAPAVTPTTSDGPGFYTWIATYNGDEINAGKAGACTDANETQELVGPQLTLTKGTPHATITAGDDVVYDVELANVGAGSASGVVVTDVLPILAGGGTWTLDPTAGYDCSIAAGTGANINHQVVTCTVGQLDPSAKTQIAEVSAPTTAADCGPINNSAVLAADPDVSQTAGPVTVTVKCPHLAIVKDADDASVNVGSSIGFTVTATNDGQGTATGVLVNDPLPTGPGITWTIVGSTGPLTCVIDTGTLKCTGSLGEGLSETVHITSPTEWTGSGDNVVNSCLGGPNHDGTYDNTAQVSASNVLNSPSDDAQTQVLCPSLHVTKTSQAPAVNAGTPIGFTIVASNTGAGSATGALIDDTLPTGVNWTIVDANTSGPLDCGILNGELTCTGTLAAGESEHVEITAPTSFLQCGTYDNTATLTAENTPQAPDASASTQVLCADVVVHKTSDATSVSVGSDIGFTVTVTNEGDGQATGVDVEDPLPVGEGVNWSVDVSNGPLDCSIAAGTGANLGHQVLSCTGDLAASGDEGDGQTVHITSSTVWNADLNSCGNYQNTASLTWGNGPDEPISSNQATEAVLCPDLTFVKTPDAASVSAGDPIGFSIEVQNGGAGTATAAAIHDPLPAPTGSDVVWGNVTVTGDGQGVSCQINGSPGAQTLDCTLGDRAPETDVVIHVSAATTPQSCGAYDNTATLTTTNVPDAHASASTAVLCPAVTFVKTADQASVNAGSQIGFTITASNGGGAGVGTARGVVIDDPLPSGTGIDWFITSGPGNCTIQGAPPTETLHCTAVDLARGASESVHVASGTGTSVASCKAYPNVASLAARNAPALTASATTQVINCVIVSPPIQKPHPHVLPNTGGPNGWIAAGGLAMVLAGGTLVLADQRRRRRS